MRYLPIVLLLAACASARLVHPTKHTEEAFRADLYECRLQVTGGLPMQQTSMIEDCMYVKGWRRE